MRKVPCLRIYAAVKTAKYTSFNTWMSSHVTAFRLSHLQLVPHANHLSWGLVMCRVVVFDAAKLAEFQVVKILDGS